jgi:hypothetical protein
MRTQAIKPPPTIEIARGTRPILNPQNVIA